MSTEIWASSSEESFCADLPEDGERSDDETLLNDEFDPGACPDPC